MMSLGLSSGLLLRFAGIAESSALVLLGARHFWNSWLPMLGLAASRKLCRSNLQKVISIINRTEAKKPVRGREHRLQVKGQAG